MKLAKSVWICICLLWFATNSSYCQNTTSDKTEILISDQLKWSERMALSVMKRHQNAWQIDYLDKPKWEYKPSFVLFSFDKLYQKNPNKVYQDYIKNYLDIFIDTSGTITHYEQKDFNIDFINPGKLLFEIYNSTHELRYLKALQQLKNQLELHPRTPSGGFWHKKIYPNQMWLDGLYMGTPFYTRYTVTFENGNGLNDIANQFELFHNNDFDSKSGLPFHAWDESKSIGWANKDTGTSPTIWSRAVGWYFMALVEVLDYYPKNHSKYNELIKYLNEIAKDVATYQDISGLWFQVTDAGNKESNYLETSSSSMFAYAFAKSVNKGYLPKKYLTIARNAFDGILKNYVKVDASGEVHLEQISFSAGLGGTPFRDGSYKQYTEGKKIIDNSIGVGAFILAALELNK